MRPKLGAVALALALTLAAGVAVAVAVSGGGASGRSAEASKRAPLQFEQHDLYIEYNATAGDAGLQLGADAEDWTRFELLDTTGSRSSTSGPRVGCGARSG